MANDVRIIRNFMRFDPRNFRFVFILACFLIPFALHEMSKHYSVEFPNWNFLAYWTADFTEEDEIPITSDFIEELSLTKKTNISCDFTSLRSDICDINGVIQIISNSPSINYFSPNKSSQIYNKSFKLKPHARKQDKFALSSVTEISIEPISLNQTMTRCTKSHTAPAIVFSAGGYTGNMFHDFTDVLIPLFITSYKFNKEVHFLIREMKPWWVKRYKSLLKQLSMYKIVDLNKVKRELCYSHLIVGLKFHKEMSIEPKKTNNTLSMLDFVRIVRKSFRLERESAINLGFNKTKKKPRLLIIARKKTRSFTNTKEIVLMAKKLGFEVLVRDANSHTKLDDFAPVVNSCDVLMGVHGAGLTNLVFLPSNAIVIQIVPLGGLERISKEDFGIPAFEMNLKYLQYNIAKEESTLIEQYPKDHVVFTDPLEIRRKGWIALRSTYLVNQNVKLDVERFKGILTQALEFLHY
ncbi:hypothetical protein LUZ60_009854 [Juncus effusus]|nr:hypothetical protein LUZ60_009854 [Juncus effusus]